MRLKIIILILLLFPSLAWGACGGTTTVSGDTYTAYDASYDCVALAVSDAETGGYGKTVQIPACAAGDCVWTSGITIVKDMKIVGDGDTSTYLTNGGMGGSPGHAFFKYTPDETSRGRLSTLGSVGTFEVSGIHFYKASDRETYTYGVWLNNPNTPPIMRVKIHDNKYTNIHRATQVIGYVHGVFYDNEIVDGNGAAVGGVGILQWTNDLMTNYTTSDGKGWYIEDNTFTFNGTDSDITYGGNEGAGHFVRYNTTEGTTTSSLYFETHSVAGGSVKGSQITEAYGNNLTSTAGSGIDMRGGKVMVFFNVVNDDTIRVRQEYRDDYAGETPTDWTLMTQNPSCAAENTPWDCCTGDGTGTCTAQACPYDNSTHCYKINNSYLFNNRNYSGGAIREITKGSDSWNVDLSINSDPAELVINREWWQDNTSFVAGTSTELTSGVGCGTVEQMNMVTTCTEGVGFWATSQSCTSLTGMVGAHPSTPISGTLYRCGSSNNWVAYFTPYTYPHPLRTTAPTISIGSGSVMSIGAGGATLTLY